MLLLFGGESCPGGNQYQQQSSLEAEETHNNLGSYCLVLHQAAYWAPPLARLMLPEAVHATMDGGRDINTLRALVLFKTFR